MSLINNMLKDLEKRKSTHQLVVPVQLFEPNYARVSHLPKKMVFYGFLISFILISALLYFFYYQDRITLTPIVQKKITPIEKKMTNLLKENTWLTPTVIQGITLQVKDNVTEIAFILDKSALYQLKLQNLQNQFSVIIENTRLQAGLPPVSYLNTAISHITATPINNGTRFDLQLIPNANIVHVNLNDAEKNPELVIAIESPIPESKQTTLVEETIEKKVEPVIKPALQNLLTQQYQEALSLIEKGQTSVAIDRITALLKIHPKFKDARLSLAALLLEQQLLSKAELVLDEGLQLTPEYAPFIELKARILATLGAHKKALHLLQTLSPNIDDYPGYHALLAAMHERNNNHALAANLYRQLLTLNPHNGNWWLGLGVSLDKLGATAPAIDAYANAMQVGHLNVESITYLQDRMQILQGNNTHAKE